MISFVVAFGLLLHIGYWGAGLALLSMPRPWRRFWPMLMAPAGIALQSAVVWAGAYANLPGTNSYAGWSEIVPTVLLLAGLRRHGWRSAWTDLSRFGIVWLATAGSLAMLVLPLAFAAKGLTTISLGSCDAADYAAGARVFMEFARSDRTGFLGLTEVVRVMSADNFFDFWLRLNHFTPSALLALNGTVLHCAPHELGSLLTMVLLASSVPVVFWAARAVLGYSGGSSCVMAALYGLSPVTWYAAAHVAPAQLIAAQAIALLTWAGVALWRGRLSGRRAVQFGAVLVTGYWLVLGSYNFIVLVCLVPAVAFAGGLALWHGQWGRLGRWFVAVLAPLGACAVIFPGRVTGLVERFTLLRTYDFGWPIPALTPEGWLGMVSGPDLAAWHIFGLRWFLAAGVVIVLGWAMARAVRQRRRTAWVAAAMALPVLVGYAYLEWRGVRLGTNASYDAYKLFAVFYPLLLPAVCWWITLRRSRRLVEWFAVVALAFVVVGFNLAGVGMFMWRMASPPLMVDGSLRQLRKIEAMPEVTSINVLLPDMWSRLWANAFLLRKPQYFLTTTYEARWATPLRGEWNLEGGIIAVELPGGASKRIASRYTLAPVRHPASVRADFGPGWHAEEQIPGGGERWRWTERDATLRFENPHDHPVTVVCTLDARSIVAREIEGELRGGGPRFACKVGEARAAVALPAVTLPPGRSELALHSVQPATQLPGDSRALGLCVFGVTVSVRE